MSFGTYYFEMSFGQQRGSVKLGAGYTNVKLGREVWPGDINPSVQR